MTIHNFGRVNHYIVGIDKSINKRSEFTKYSLIIMEKETPHHTLIKPLNKEQFNKMLMNFKKIEGMKSQGMTYKNNKTQIMEEWMAWYIDLTKEGQAEIWKQIEEFKETEVWKEEKLRNFRNYQYYRMFIWKNYDEYKKRKYVMISLRNYENKRTITEKLNDCEYNEIMRIMDELEEENVIITKQKMELGYEDRETLINLKDERQEKILEWVISMQMEKIEGMRIDYNRIINSEEFVTLVYNIEERMYKIKIYITKMKNERYNNNELTHYPDFYEKEITKKQYLKIMNNSTDLTKGTTQEGECYKITVQEETFRNLIVKQIIIEIFKERTLEERIKEETNTLKIKMKEIHEQKYSLTVYEKDRKIGYAIIEDVEWLRMKRQIRDRKDEENPEIIFTIKARHNECNQKELKLLKDVEKLLRKNVIRRQTEKTSEEADIYLETEEAGESIIENNY